jgi:hypothetical protein
MIDLLKMLCQLAIYLTKLLSKEFLPKTEKWLERSVTPRVVFK